MRPRGAREQAQAQGAPVIESGGAHVGGEWASQVLQLLLMQLQKWWYQFVSGGSRCLHDDGRPFSFQ
jgi:hypothetical protein